VSEVCGCVNIIDAKSGILRNASKCAFHVESLKEDADAWSYFNKLGIIVDGVPQCRKYERELLTNAPPLIADGPNDHALEIGCGFSPYVPLFHKLGYSYLGIDPRPLACEWTSSTHCCSTRCTSIENFDSLDESYDVVLAAHVLEHVEDAPDMMRKIFDLLKVGGQAIIIVPNGYDDPTNPDHLWFFTESTLVAAMTAAGFVSTVTNQRRIVERERFIYASAMKGSR